MSFLSPIKYDAERKLTKNARIKSPAYYLKTGVLETDFANVLLSLNNCAHWIKGNKDELGVLDTVHLKKEEKSN